MDTSQLKPFAQQMRTDLRRVVTQRLRYWGFKEDGRVDAEPEAIEGGYVFREEVHDDASVPKKWRGLKNAVNTHSFDDVVEEAAYTWFNRLLAIRVLEKNDHIQDVLGYASGTGEPAILQRAKNGIMPFLKEREQEAVKQAILESDDDVAFRRLLVGFCHSHDLLNDVFGRINDFTELLLPTGLLQHDGVIERLVTTDAISDDDYAQVELIGWLYQFYISEKKDEVYDQSGKFQPEDIPAATQIFTPRWIVRYMVENTIGRQWLDKYPESPLRGEMDYLVESGSVGERENGGEGEQGEMFSDDDATDPAEPIFDDLSELELFDPAAGSGHILVVGFELLMEMYRERGYTDREAVEQILTENLKGLEIDRRAAQLARFALLMKAAEYDARALDRTDLRPEVYAMPEERHFTANELRLYLGDEVFDAHGAEVKEALDLMAEHGKNVGSALKLDLSDDARDTVAHRVAVWDEKTQNGLAQLDEQALHQVLRGYLKPLVLLTEKYPSVAANPPYLGNRKMNEPLKKYLKENYPRSKKNVFAVFIEEMIDVLKPAGRLGTITMESWMFLSSFERLRSHLIDNYQIRGLAHFGYGILGIEFGTAAFILRNSIPDETTVAEYSRLEETDINPETRAPYTFPIKDNNRYAVKAQQDFKKIPEAPIAYWVPDATIRAFNEYSSLGDLTIPKFGMSTGNNKKYLRQWSEVNFDKIGIGLTKNRFVENNFVWAPLDKGGGNRKWYGYKEMVVLWEDNGNKIKSDSSSAVRSPQYFFRPHASWSLVNSAGFGARLFSKGYILDTASNCLYFENGIRYDIIGFLNSNVAYELLKILNPTMNFSCGVVGRLPFIPGSQAVSRKLSQESVEISQRDWDSRETSWDFEQHPLVQKNAPSLESAYEAWTKQATDDFLELHANEEKLNEVFTDLYGLEGELSPRVALDDITILKDELDRDALENLDDERADLSYKELRQRFLEDDPDDALFKVEVPIRQFLSYGIGVMLGRYRLGHDGLHIAHPNPSSDELAPYEVPVPLSGSESNGTEQFEIDDDAIVPLMGRDSPFSDDAVYRMREIVRLVWGEDTLTENLNFINRALSIGRGRGLKRDYEKTMEEWLVGDFWDWHKSLYSVPYYGKKPIYWLFASPERHFQVLVYMHRMDKFTPQRVRQQYLQRYQSYLRREIESLEAEGEESLSGDDAKRLDTLRAAADDCRAYDAILKEVAEQQIEIDLDDGVQNNYPKFGDAVADL
jgi:hypothetical protein